MAEVEGGPLRDLGCADGALSPATFICRASCMQEPPTILYTDPARLQDCRGTPHNASCSTPCQAGFEKDSDLFCDDGVWSSEAHR